VTDALSGAAIEADVELFDLATGDLATGAYSDPRTGEFLICVPAGRDYALNTSAEGYLFHSSNHSVKQSGMNAPLELSVPLSPIKSGQSIALHNIFFETARYDLLPASNVELNKLLKLMQATPTLRIEVGGHTDHVGDDASNQTLSEQRANAVRSFLIGKGIDGTRIVAKGYGESKPVASNENEEGRASNRRTEITVL
jgi:outer membrane protein OmpA-like peptidoglycan-associated protein